MTDCPIGGVCDQSLNISAGEKLLKNSTHPSKLATDDLGNHY